MKLRLYLSKQLGNQNRIGLDFGWFGGEYPTLFHVEVLTYEDYIGDSWALTIFRIQVLKFLFTVFISRG